ncbi:Bgt-308 [Blumeria graminis f. sp. tritici]|uniref:Bgt-308 n=3 Tax=Blumeria graminis TaxID=34373 RepID=A0A381LDP2_BLUGR|nr:Activator of meiotic anaphase promoting complex [Blumeria graminis f. sp. tritici 96224]VDB88811.1 Bgt-308 [Blumeria graminis f. sp. tritici]
MSREACFCYRDDFQTLFISRIRKTRAIHTRNTKITRVQGVTDHRSLSSKRQQSKLLKNYGYDGQDDEVRGKFPSINSDTCAGYLSSALPYQTRKIRVLHPGPLKLHPRNSPDRFLPTRQHGEITVENFKTNKGPWELSPTERRTRKDAPRLNGVDGRRNVLSSSTILFNPISRRYNMTSRIRNTAGGLSDAAITSRSGGVGQVRIETVWRFSGLAPTISLVGRRERFTSNNSNAPAYTSSFSAKLLVEDNTEIFEGLLATALSIDRNSRVFDFCQPKLENYKSQKALIDSFENQCASWCVKEKNFQKDEIRILPTAPFKVLDAPNLRDDFYCSVIAYSAASHTLAVGLGPLLYAWSESQGVHLLDAGTTNGSWLTSLAFSSDAGKKSILGYGRSNGLLSFMSLYDSVNPRFDLQLPCAIACLTWRPQVVIRPSKSPSNLETNAVIEEILVGDEMGNVYYYSVEWPEELDVNRNGWSGSITLMARISIHSQQICGISFSNDGSMFATGGNDNLCCLFQTDSIHNRIREELCIVVSTPIRNTNLNGARLDLGRIRTNECLAGSERHRWVHGAAVKAIAFCPWKKGLIATGGGSNDKCIHFYHASSGTCLATISVFAQVTSLIWSVTRKEICATFGFAQPEHPYRIAVFSWPGCKQIAAIPWDGGQRALYAIPYRGGPNESYTSNEDDARSSRTAQEGCIVIASSDESIKFHEVWSGCQKTTAVVKGLLGGSDVIEGLESIDKDGDIIR